MNARQRIQQVLLGMIVILGSSALAQPDFFEDFSDGDPTDGSPVTWQPIFVWDGTGYNLTPDGLDVAGALLCNPDGTVPTYDEVAITAQIRRHANNSGAEWASGFLFRYNANWTNGYWMEVRGPNQFLLGYSNGTTLGQATLPFNVDEQDLVIHMEAQGSDIKGWCWPVGQEMPKEPQIVVVDGRARTGQIALHAWSVGGQSLFRSVEVYSIKTPIVDFNGDGALNIDDLAMFIETWGQDDPMTDFWHDGTIDRKDLEILMDAWGQDVDDPTLLTHWALDETEGDTATDSTGMANATVVGTPTWHSDAGAVNGAIELDGENDNLVTPSILNPDEGPFSLLAWVKGGAAGQTIVSQNEGENWLCLDPINGWLMTEIKQDGRSSKSLCSETGIDDGDWHRIALVWDGQKRTLYVDGVIVAKDDSPNALKGCNNGLNIGCNTNTTPGTHFKGLLDDIRIYNRVVKP